MGWFMNLFLWSNYFSPLASSRFNQLSEIPRLERWFRTDSNPSKQKLMSYMHMLNTTPYRRVNPKVTYQQLCNWFANQRASQRQNNHNGDQSSGQGHQSKHSSSLNLMNGSDSNSLNAFNLAAKLMSSSSSLAATNTSTTNSASAQQLASAFFKNPLFLGAMAGFDSQQLLSQMQPSLASQFLDGFRGVQDRDFSFQAQDGTPHIPISLLPTDIASKFNGFGGGKMDANGGADHSNLHAGERIDGGSESPTGNDDVSVHSGASDGDAGDEAAKDSGTSTPDCLDVITPHSPNRQLQAATAAALLGGNRPLSPNSSAVAAFSSLLPTMSFLNSTLAAASANSTSSHNNGSSSPGSDGGKLRAGSFSMKTPSMKQEGNGEGGKLTGWDVVWD